MWSHYKSLLLFLILFSLLIVSFFVFFCLILIWTQCVSARARSHIRGKVMCAIHMVDSEARKWVFAKKTRESDEMIEQSMGHELTFLSAMPYYMLGYSARIYLRLVIWSNDHSPLCSTSNHPVVCAGCAWCDGHRAKLLPRCLCSVSPQDSYAGTSLANLRTLVCVRRSTLLKTHARIASHPIFVCVIRIRSNCDAQLSTQKRCALFIA